MFYKVFPYLLLKKKKFATNTIATKYFPKPKRFYWRMPIKKLITENTS